MKRRFKAANILAQNLLLHHEASKLLKKFYRKGLKVIVLKGFALARKLKTDPFKRPQCDLDLLIQRQDFEKIKAILENHGYKIDWKSGPADLESKLARLGEISFVKNYPKLKTKVEIDLHFSPFLPSEWVFKLGTEKVTLFTLAEKKKITKDFFKRAAWVKDELSYWTLSTEDTLLHLCLHAYFHHHCRGPRLSEEISQFIQRTGTP